MSQGSAKKAGANPGWQDYTPALSNLSQGNGTIEARYIQIGTLVWVRFEFTLGSTSTIGTAPSIGLPVTASSVYNNINEELGWATLIDTGTATYKGRVRLSNTTSVVFDQLTVSGSNVIASAINATSPFTWTNTDMLVAEITYEAAASEIIAIGKNNDHGLLSGLTDDDHTQYFNTTRHDADDHSAILESYRAAGSTGWDTSWTTKASLSLGAGVWLIQGYGRIEVSTSTTQVYLHRLQNTTDSVTYVTGAWRVGDLNTQGFWHGSYIVDLASTKTIALQTMVGASSGTQLGYERLLMAVKLSGPLTTS